VDACTPLARGLESRGDLNGARGVVVLFGKGAAGRGFQPNVPYSAQLQQF